MTTIIKIKAFENGGHDNQTGEYFKTIPKGWAVVPDKLETPNFPFGEITVEEIDGIVTVTSWTPKEIPEPEPLPEPETELTTNDMAIAILEGVNEV